MKGQNNDTTGQAMHMLTLRGVHITIVGQEKH